MERKFNEKLKKMTLDLDRANPKRWMWNRKRDAVLIFDEEINGILACLSNMVYLLEEVNRLQKLLGETDGVKNLDRMD